MAGGLSRLLADTYTPYLTTHNFHWNVTGPMFNTLHAMFMAQYTELWNAVDPIAERASDRSATRRQAVTAAGADRRHSQAPVPPRAVRAGRLDSFTPRAAAPASTAQPGATEADLWRANLDCPDARPRPCP